MTWPVWARRPALRGVLGFGVVLLLLGGFGQPRPARADEPGWQGHALGQAGIWALVAAPGQPGLLYAAGLGLQGTVATDFFRSVDGGATWAMRSIVGSAWDDGAFLDFFSHRGGVQTFGYPTSRTFTFQGFPVQFFQRQVMQQFPDGSVHLLNLLDPGLLPYTSFNFSTFPAPDPGLVAAAPAVGSASYGDAVVAFVQQHAPDTWNGLPVQFQQTFLGTVGLQQVLSNPAGGSWQSPGILALVNLELWGLPTSAPEYDPANHGFVYLRFQRGIMQYDASCACTHGILLADYLKSVLTGSSAPGALPADLAQEAAHSPFLDQYDPAAPNWVRHPGRLPNTEMTDAFTPE